MTILWPNGSCPEWLSSNLLFKTTIWWLWWLQAWQKSAFHCYRRAINARAGSEPGNLLSQEYFVLGSGVCPPKGWTKAMRSLTGSALSWARIWEWCILGHDWTGVIGSTYFLIATLRLKCGHWTKLPTTTFHRSCSYHRRRLMTSIHEAVSAWACASFGPTLWPLAAEPTMRSEVTRDADVRADVFWRINGDVYLLAKRWCPT